MIGIALAALAALAQPDAEVPRPNATQANAPAESGAGRRSTRRRALAPPNLSLLADPYRSEPSYTPAKVDAQHPTLAPLPDDLDTQEQGLPRVSPVPPDPWAPAVQPLPPPGGAVRPPGSEG